EQRAVTLAAVARLLVEGSAPALAVEVGRQLFSLPAGETTIGVVVAALGRVGAIEDALTLVAGIPDQTTRESIAAGSLCQSLIDQGNYDNALHVIAGGHVSPWGGAYYTAMSAIGLGKSGAAARAHSLTQALAQ